MRVLAVSGSPRKGGNTDQALEIVLDALQSEGIDGELYRIGGQSIHGCTACRWCRANKENKCVREDDCVNELIEKANASQAILLGSPVYFADMTPEMKAVIDRVGVVTRNNGATLARKVGASVAVARRGGAIHTFNSMNHFFLINEMIVPGSSYWNLVYGLEKGDIERDEEGVATLRRLGENMAWLLKKLHA